MGKCSNCGQTAIFLRKIPCKICGKVACDKCAIYSFKLLDAGKTYVLDSWYVCSKLCMETLASRLEKGITPNKVSISENEAVDKIFDLLYEVLTSPENKQWLGDYLFTVSKNKQFHVSFDADFSNKQLLVGYTNSLENRLEKHTRLIVAQHLVTAGRFEDAAKLCERLGMYTEAGKARAKTSEIKIRRTEVSVDLNNLLGQLKNGGVVLVYRCPHCGGKLKVSKESKVESLRRCEHCGSEIEAIDLADFIKSALS